MSKTAKVAVGAVVLFLALGLAAWWFLLRDTAAPEANVDAVSAGRSAAAADRSTPDGNWKVEAGESVFVGYRIRELFAAATVKRTATGRTPRVQGTMSVAGRTVSAARVSADLIALESDQARRDAAIHERGLETDRFPVSTFTLTAPITLPSAPVKGKTYRVSATGDLLLHGVTRPVSIELSARWNGATISVAGGAPVLLSDYGMEAIRVPGLVETDDRGTLELQLLLVPA
jgi:polyisoprenoid-binding protein YceI